ncbi:MAG: DUF1028 domain-containing protein [Chloroflexi bacterium]|nr:DUF1028 domain-containing protein [Chloroflexota bacterium]
MTYSIVAYDATAKAWGVATQSKFLAVGAVVPWTQANAGAIATQSYANTSFGPQGLALLSTGLSAQETLDRLLADDDGREHRQVGVIDQHGGAATFTGKDCHAWAGGLIGNGYAVQGNILVGEETVKAIARGFEAASSELADRLVAALAAGQAAGGDRRGQQSAAVLVVRERGGYAGFNDRYLDLRVDDDPRPIERLQRILELHHLYFAKPDPATLIAIDAALARELQRLAQRSGHYRGAITGEYDAATRAAVEALIGTENLEDRWPLGTDQIEPVALRYLQQRYPSA